MTGQARVQLERVVLPFWVREGIDSEHGGFHTCFDNRGRSRQADDKYTWSQGRFVWLLARAASLVSRGMLDVPGAGGDRLLEWAGRGAHFLSDHAVRSDGTCAFALSRDGSRPVATQPDRSVYADLFAAMGFAEFARVSGERQWLSVARRIVDRATEDIRARVAPTPPYAIPAGRRAFGPHLILLNALGVLTEAERHLTGESTRDEILSDELDAVMSFRVHGSDFAEMPLVGDATGEDLVSRHRVPGHALEAMWIALDAIELLGGSATEHQPAALDAIPALCALGWDDEQRGLFRYTDRDGGAPRGAAGESAYERLVLRTWDTKLWWVHTEASAVTAIAASRYGRQECEPWAKRIWDYTLSTFPGGDEGEEWVQIRNRDGSPRDEVVALPVKDPFHIARNLMQLVELDSPRRSTAEARTPR